MVLHRVVELSADGLRRLVPQNDEWAPTSTILFAAMAVAANTIYANLTELHQFIIRVGALPIDPAINVRAAWRFLWDQVVVPFWEINVLAFGVAVEQVHAQGGVAPGQGPGLHALLGAPPQAG